MKVSFDFVLKTFKHSIYNLSLCTYNLPYLIPKILST